MGKPLVAIADTVFPSLEPAKAALARLDPELRLAEQPTAEAILEVARRADAVMVTYAKITGDMIRGFERCRSIGLEPALLAPWADVDEPADLRRLAASMAAGGHGCPRTRELLESWGRL